MRSCCPQHVASSSPGSPLASAEAPHQRRVREGARGLRRPGCCQLPEPLSPGSRQAPGGGSMALRSGSSGGHTPLPSADTGSGSALAEATAQVVSFCLNLKRQRLPGGEGELQPSPPSSPLPHLPPSPPPAAPRGHPWDIQKPMARPAPCGPRALGSAGAVPVPGEGLGWGWAAGTWPVQDPTRALTLQSPGCRRWGASAASPQANGGVMDGR